MDREELRNSLIQVIRLLDKGIAMERNARNFYSHAARTTKSPEGKKLFEWLANFEIGHKQRLEAKSREIRGHSVLQDVELPKLGEFSVSEAIWPEDFPSQPSDVDIVKLAIENEKRAYAFFQRKITIIKDDLLLKLLETLAHEEEKHMKILNDQLDSLTNDRIWGKVDDLDDFFENLKI